MNLLLFLNMPCSDIGPESTPRYISSRDSHTGECSLLCLHTASNYTEYFDSFRNTHVQIQGEMRWEIAGKVMLGIVEACSRNTGGTSAVALAHFRNCRDLSREKRRRRAHKYQVTYSTPTGTKPLLKYSKRGREEPASPHLLNYPSHFPLPPSLRWKPLPLLIPPRWAPAPGPRNPSRSSQRPPHRHHQPLLPTPSAAP